MNHPLIACPHSVPAECERIECVRGPLQGDTKNGPSVGGAVYSAPDAYIGDTANRPAIAGSTCAPEHRTENGRTCDCTTCALARFDRQRRPIRDITRSIERVGATLSPDSSYMETHYIGGRTPDTVASRRQPRLRDAALIGAPVTLKLGDRRAAPVSVCRHLNPSYCECPR